MSFSRIPQPSSASLQLHDELLLLRYMPFPRFLTLLRGKLSFTPMRLLRSVNDPSEGMPISDPDVIYSALGSLPKPAEVFERLTGAANKWAKVVLSQSSTKSSTRKQLTAQSFHKLVDETRAVSCWFTNEYESAAMWASFAPQGVAVEIALSGLERSLPADRDFLIGSVRYRDREKFKIGQDNAEKYSDFALRPFLLKGREFAHEKEVRVVTRCDRDQEWFAVRVRGIVKSIRRVIISPYVDADSAAALKKHIETTLRAKLGSEAAPRVTYSTINKRHLKERASNLKVRRRYHDPALACLELPL